jgi:penicillin-binding protein 1A
VSKSPTIIDDPAYGHIDIKTYGGVGAGTLTLRRATLQSDNSVYIQLALDVGPDEVKKTARMMGITSTLKGYPAETLGGLENGVSPLEMATAYSSIANGGFRVRPTAIKKIVFPGGRVEESDKLPERFRVKRTKIFSDGVTAEATDILHQNLVAGTGTRAGAQMPCPAAGKTGTTDNNTDAWFVGFTPHLATSVWVGYPKNDIQMNGLFFGMNVDGGTFPAVIWGDYMNRIHGSYCGNFSPPKHPFVSQPFYGRYSHSGGKLTEGDTGGAPDATAPSTSTPSTGGTQAPTGTTEPGNNGNGNGNGQGFDPTQYESPPQGPPKTQTPATGNDGVDTGTGGGATAPGTG